MEFEQGDRQLALDKRIEELDRKVMSVAGQEYDRYRSAFASALPAEDGTDIRLIEGTGLMTVVSGLLNGMRIRGGGMDGLITPKQKADVLAKVKDHQLNAIVDSAACFLQKVQQDKTLPGHGDFRIHDRYLVKAAEEALVQPKRVK